MPKLIVLTDGIEPTSFDLTKELTSVGRVDGNDIVLPHQSVSGSHGELVLRGKDNVYIRDLGSTNGVRVNAQPVQVSEIKPGDRVEVGDITFTFLLTG